MSEETNRRPRRCGPKTRTGCRTCKIRRVKCDEAKPSCLRCTGTGRKCDGYVTPELRDLLKSSSDEMSSSLILQRLIARVPGNPQERRGFHYFIKETTPDLNGFFTSGFWEHLILQASHIEPALRHTIVAIGAIHEDFAQTRLGQKPKLAIGGGLPFAVKQYTKAIGHLRRSLATGNEAPLTALMSCILFVCFDCLRGYYHTAMVHLKSGMSILQDMRAQNKSDPLIEDIIAPLFVRLNVQSILYVDTSLPEQRKAFGMSLLSATNKPTPIPEVFENLNQARCAMNECADGLFKALYICDAYLPMAQQPPGALAMLERYGLRILQWGDAFEKFMDAKSRFFNSKEIRGAALLKVHHTTLTIMSEITPEQDDPRNLADAVNNPEDFDKFIPRMWDILNLCKSLIAASEHDEKNGKPAYTFSTDLGLVAPLYYVAMKPRSQELRQQAVDLLKRCPRKEGMWDSASALKLIKEYWVIEVQQKELQTALATSENQHPSQLPKIVDLVFFEGGKWEWIWRDVGDTSALSRPTPSADRELLSYVDPHTNLNGFDAFEAFEGRGTTFEAQYPFENWSTGRKT